MRGNMQKAPALKGRSFLAAGEGFEPSHTESESAVLPLHNPAKRKSYYNRNIRFVKHKLRFSSIFLQNLYIQNHFLALSFPQIYLTYQYF